MPGLTAGLVLGIGTPQHRRCGSVPAACNSKQAWICKKQISDGAARQPSWCRSLPASAPPHGEAAPPRNVLLLWDLDNLSPAAADVQLWACSLQEAVMRLGGRLDSFGIVANPATLQRHTKLRADLEVSDARLLEASCRPEAADMLISTAAIDFAKKHGACGRVAIASNDTGFAAVLAYVAALGCETVSIGTWHQQKRFGARRLGWTRHPLAQAACISVLWNHEEPETAPNFSRSKPDRIWRRLADVRGSDCCIPHDSSSEDSRRLTVPHGIWRRSRAAAREVVATAGTAMHMAG